MPPALTASVPSSARQTTAITSATGRAEATRAITIRHRLVWASSASRRVRAIAVRGRVSASRQRLW